MAEILLFHHVLGAYRRGRAFANEIRLAGHDVTTPDRYDGATFDTIEDGLAHAEQLGFGNIIEEGEGFVDGLAAGLVYAGFSMGAMVAHKLAQNRPGALGALLYHHGDVPIDTFGDSWPQGVDLQIHVNREDPYYEPDVAEEFVSRAGESADAELFVYPGSSHLFADSSLPDYDADSTALVMQRTLGFLERHR
jgi:dienelactone hydrolase